MSLPSRPAPLWNVPYQRNSFFTGREDELRSLHHALQIEDAVALSHPYGLSGLGGIGKTQLALEYAYSYGGEYQTVLWVRADSRAALTSSFVDLARMLNLPEYNEQDQNIIVEAVLRWLRLHSKWLLIFDNMDDLLVAEPFLPKVGLGHIVFTTRAHSLGGIAQRLEVQQMEPNTGALLLLRRASLIPLQATLDLAARDDGRLASKISQELDGLPLALDQAGAYVKETSCTLADYLLLYEQRRSNLLQIPGTFNKDYPASVATTWSLSFEKVEKANPASTELLNLCAFLAPDAIPEEIFTTGAPYLGSILAPVAANPVQLDLACKEALRFSLIAREADAQTFSIHRLVQVVLQDMLPLETCVTWKHRTVSAVNATFPSGAFERWTECERLLSHALVCANWIEQEHITDPGMTLLLNNTGVYLHGRGQYTEAEPLLQQALAICEHVLGSEHPDTAIRLGNLATLYHAQGKYGEAESLNKRALAIREQQLGTMHPDTALGLNSLAALYYAQGLYEEAEPLYQRALTIREQQLGAVHPDTATSLNNLAGLYAAQEKYWEAEPLAQRALAIYEQQLGVMHPTTVSSLSNLAGLYFVQGKYGEVEPLFQRVLVIYEQQLGPSHPNTSKVRRNYVLLLRAMGRNEEANKLEEGF